jgi:hypothetical protein
MDCGGTGRSGEAVQQPLHRADRLEARVWDGIEKTLSNPDAIMALFAQRKGQSKRKQG